jgi:hypothetical protein
MKLKVKALDKIDPKIYGGEIFRSKLNGKKWQVVQNTLGLRIELIHPTKKESHWLRSCMEYVMKFIKKGIEKLKELKEILEC